MSNRVEPYPVTVTIFTRRDGAYVAAYAPRPTYNPLQFALEVMGCMSLDSPNIETQYDIHVALNTPDGDRPRVGYFTWNRREYIDDIAFRYEIMTWLDATL